MFGKGDVQTLSLAAQRDPAAMTAHNYRVMLFSAAEEVRNERAAKGLAPLDVEQQVHRALMREHPERYLQQFQQQLRHNTNGQLQNRRGVQASRPTARKTPLGTKEERTLSKLHGKYPKGGFDQSDEEFSGEI
jgi:hypothetical protein